tara:strand:+ start:575 stop:1078 length:504 start_codon:yes stop_codon:yes gene_type:complete
MGNRRMGLGRLEALLEAVDRDLDLTNSTLTNCDITTTEFCTFGGVTCTAYAATATSDGLTTGVIPDGASFVTVTSANAAHIVLLPPPVAGKQVWVNVGGNGCEVRAGTAAGADGSGTIAIGANTPTGGHESALAANMTALFVCTSGTNWVGLTIASNNAVAAAEVAA